MSRRRTQASRRGIALVAALGMTTLLGLLIAGAVAASTLAHRAATAQLDQGSLTAALDVAAVRTLAAASSLGLSDLRPGSSLAFDPTPSSNGAVRVSGSASAIGAGTLWIVLDARSVGDSTHRRRANLIARFPLAGVLPPAPIVSHDSAIISTDATLEADASCGGMLDKVHRTTDSTTLYASRWQDVLLASAGGVWRIGRDTTIGAASYEGIVIADGDLTIDGSADLRGLVIARGRLRVTGGARVTGALVSQDSGIEISAAQLRYSPCIAGLVLRRAVGARTVRGRSWAELF